MKLACPLGILVALSLAACTRAPEVTAGPGEAGPGAHPAIPDPTPPAPGTGSHKYARHDTLPPTVKPLLPKHGILAAGGGTASAPWRAIVDLDAGTVTSAASKTVGASWFGKMEPESTRPLTDAEKTDFGKLTQHAWGDPMPVLTTPASDYDEVLAMTDGDDVFFLRGYGPIRPPHASVLVDKLKKIASP